jgi:hypothetical protein
MDTKIYGTLAVGIASALMIYARRYKNQDSNAGYGIAGWTVFILLCIWI